MPHPVLGTEGPRGDGDRSGRDLSRLLPALPHPQPLTMLLALALDLLLTTEGTRVEQSEDGGAYTEHVTWVNCLHLEMGMTTVTPHRVVVGNK